MSPLITVIVSAYNRPKRLWRALASVDAQTVRDKIQVVVCDNGSPGQEQKEMLDGIAARGIEVLRGPVEEPEARSRYCPLAAMINRGLDVAKGKFVRYLLDSDEYTPNSCEALSDYLRAHEQIDIVWGSVIRIENGVEISPPPYYTMHNQAVHDILKQKNVVNHNSAMHRKTMVRWDEGPEAWKKADWLFWRRLADAGFRFANIPNPVEKYDMDGRFGASREAQGQTIAEALKARFEG